MTVRKKNSPPPIFFHCSLGLNFVTQHYDIIKLHQLIAIFFSESVGVQDFTLQKKNKTAVKKNVKGERNNQKLIQRVMVRLER